jgi:hypothetical protein
MSAEQLRPLLGDNDLKLPGVAYPSERTVSVFRNTASSNPLFLALMVCARIGRSLYSLALLASYWRNTAR